MADIWRMLTENMYHSKCKVTVTFPGTDVSETLSLPIYPEQVSNSITTTYQDTNIAGRSGTLSVYSGTSDIVTSFSIHLHREVVSTEFPNFDNGDNNLVDKIVSLIEAAGYPLYTSTGTYTPIVIYQFGDTYIKGKQTSANTVWGGPKIGGKYMEATINISVTNTPSKVLSFNDIKGSNPRAHMNLNT